MVMNFVFKYDKDKSVRRNKMMMGLVVNKLLLAYKNNNVNGRDLLEYLVMNCEPSLENLYNTITSFKLLVIISTLFSLFNCGNPWI